MNKQTVAPPTPHLHALLTSGDDPPPEIDVFDLIKASYEVRVMSLPASSSVVTWSDWKVSGGSNFLSLQKFGSLRSDVIEQMRFKQRLKVIQSLEDTAKRSVVGVCGHLLPQR